MKQLAKQERQFLYPPVPYQITNAKTRFSSDDVDSTVFGLWMEGQQGATGRVLIATDATPFGQTVALKPAALYLSQGNLNAVPLLRAPAELFENTRRYHYNYIIGSRAWGISFAASEWAKNHGGQLPSLAELKQVVQSPVAFQNPENGKDAFTLAYTPGPNTRVKDNDDCIIGYVNLSWGRFPIGLHGPGFWELYPDAQSAVKPKKYKDPFGPRN